MSVTPIQTKRAELLAEKAALLGRLDVLQGKLDLLDEIEPQVSALPLAVETLPPVAAKPRRGVRAAHGESLTLDEVGEVFGVTRERVRQIESRVLKKVRDELEEVYLDLCHRPTTREAS